MVNWKRPLTLIYRDNHKFGSALYEPTLEECERRYTGSLQTTSFRSDRPDIAVFDKSPLVGSSFRRTSSSYKTPRPKSLFEDLHEQRSASCTRPTLDPNKDESLHHRCKLTEDRGTTRRKQISRQGSSAVRELKSELEQLQARIGDNEKAARQDASVLRDIMGGRMMEMAAKIREAEMYNEECQKIIRKQSQLMGDLQSYCAGLERKLADTIDELAASNNKVKGLYIQLETVCGD
ncbi:paramyosin-like isoform X1 [Varroa jacobsoni]|uniref:paramyosin-like isoform X1 n=1 Tax=Varroa jacobsoni TaxID=62625 RepID=UPI000BF9CF95|nr:paramyosin-like isoform X1 [Varroa jacobsoni]XP_022707171.1 paramyosin-like isoform X1 [Varroa jacobsoni]